MNDIKSNLVKSKLVSADEVDQMMEAHVKIGAIQSQIDALTQEMTQLSEQHKVPIDAFFGDISFFYMPESLGKLGEETCEGVAECFDCTYIPDFVGCWYNSYDGY